MSYQPEPELLDFAGLQPGLEGVLADLQPLAHCLGANKYSLIGCTLIIQLVNFAAAAMPSTVIRCPLTRGCSPGS